jgi:PleD family two-component response regulator
MSVLIAAEDGVATRSLKHELRSLGWAVQVVHAAGDARRALEAGDPPLLALLTSSLPDLRIADLCSALRGAKDAPYTYLLLAGERGLEQDEVDAGLRAGADACVGKPFEMDELRARVLRGLRVAQLQRTLTASAERDPETGLWMPSGWMKLLDQALTLAAHEHDQLGVLLVALPAGAACERLSVPLLREASARMHGVLRPHDCIGRYADDCFIVIVPSCGERGAQGAAQRLQRCLLASPLALAASSRLRVGIGVAVARACACDAAWLLDQAQESLASALAAQLETDALATRPHA